MKQTKMLRSLFALLTLFLVCCVASLFAQTSPAQTAPEPQLSTRDAATQQATAAANSFDQVVDRAVEREHFFMAQMKQLHPLVEAYLQNLKEDKDLGAPVPVSDVYFLGRLDMSEGTDDLTFTSPTTAGLGKRMLSKLSNAPLAAINSVRSAVSKHFRCGWEHGRAHRRVERQPVWAPRAARTHLS